MIRRLAVILALVITTRAQTPGCNTPVDVTFLLDSSDNVGQQNFKKELNFAQQVVNKLTIDPNKAQASVVTFSTGVYNQFYLNRYTNKGDVVNAISSIPFKGGQTHTSDAIKYATATSFSTLHGARDRVPHVAIVLTNSPSGSKDMVKLESQTARDNGVILYSIGVGNSIDMDELKDIASDPNSRHLFHADNYDALGYLSNLIATKVCNELPPDPALIPAPTGCLHKGDVVFMVDSSTSVGSTNFQKMEHFLKDVTSKLDVGPNKVQVGLMKYAGYPSQAFPLDMYHTRAEVMKAIEAMNYQGGGTNTGDAIKYMGNQMFSQNNGARGNVPRIAVVVTNGGSSNPAITTTEADKARMKDIGIMAVGVGSRANRAELQNIANQPSSSNVFTVNSYDDLDKITDRLIQQMCTVTATVPSLTTSSPGGTLPPDPCQDKQSNCAAYGKAVCTNYKTWARNNCARYCGTCQPLYTNAPPTCKDKLPNCNAYGRSVCSGLGQWARDNCKLYCGLCSQGASQTGYYGKCFYKGKTYNHGETWFDGCDYECTCENGNTGKYTCNNRCPVYYNLPSDCTLVTKQGQCCLEPVCNFNPQVNKYTATAPGKNANGISVCQYKSKQYFERQSWRDGCDYQCTCIDAKSGKYQCDDLCPRYTSIPPYCHLERKAGECCEKPVCEFDQQTGSFSGAGSISGNGVGATPTQAPPCVDHIATCHTYGKSVCDQYRGWATDNCRAYCNLCPNGASLAGPDDKCVYEGKFYGQGETWNPSCDMECTCDNAIYGFYRCASTCPSYNNLPNGCRTTKKTGDCCPTIQCDSGYFVSSATNPMSVGNGGMIYVKNPPKGMTQVQPTLPSGATPKPGTGGTGFAAPTLRGCLYNGQLYVQDQSWEDGCAYSCYCKDADSGLYSCRQKCPSYATLPGSCTMVPDDNDPCCKTPKCTKDPVTQKIPVPIPSFRPAQQTYGIVEPPNKQDLFTGRYTRTVYLVQTGMTPAPPTAPAGGQPGTCNYHGTVYNQGQTWEDGCDFNCVCEDGSNGHYRCTEKCVHYGQLPDQCYLVDDPVNSCCKIPKCTFPVNYITHQGLIHTTPKPQGEYCVYQGVQYNQGQSWYDQCRYKCTCEDASNNIYRCMSRCPQYQNVDPSCRFVQDPKDPACCQMPQCDVTGTFNNTGGQGQIIRPGPAGTFIGTGTGNVGYCEYKKVHYSQGQSWKDGCDFDCTCTDANSGLYKCTDICKRYPELPAYCSLVTDFTNPCCKVPQCQFPATPGSVTGHGTGAPHPGTTLAPTPPPPGQTLAPGLQPTPRYNYCVYKGAQYGQGQSWEDGCSYKCRCDDADRGLYVCNQRCASFPPPQPGCKMVTDPDDSCCLVPQCNVVPPTPGPTLTPRPTPSPGATFAPTPAPTPFPIPTAAPGQIIGSANYPTPTPGPDGKIPTLPPINYCEYKGVQYAQGQKWDDGCQYVCECVDAHIGQYKCTEKCSRYINLPPQCRLSRDPANPCCQVPECIFATPQTLVTPTPGPFGVSTKAPTPAPTGLNTPTPRPTLPAAVCVYKGKSYTQGQTWYDGCEYICNCEDALRGLYRCNNRCPTYNNLPAECVLVSDSKDPLCCKAPKCTFSGTFNNTGGYHPIPTAAPGVINGGIATPTPRPTPGGGSPTLGPGLSPTPAPIPGVSTIAPSHGPSLGPGMSPTPGTGVPTAAPPPPLTGVCVYKGNQYSQGQRWDDGCDYNCQCIDAMKGRYTCTEKCPKYLSIPFNCRMVRDYLNPCCKKPVCDPNATPTPAPNPGTGPTAAPNPVSGPTPAPGQSPPTLAPGVSTQAPTPAPKAGCVYNGVVFQQGKSWNDGCDLKCTCENSMTGFYRCNDRCAQYNNIPSYCTMETDPRDSCCRVPVCNPPPQTPTPNPIPTRSPTLAPGVSYPPGVSPPLGPSPGPGVSPPIGPSLGPGVSPTVGPTLAPGLTYPPGYSTPVPNPFGSPTPAPPTNPTPYPVPTAIITGTGVNPNPKIKGCMYHGVLYKQGQTWQDSCTYDCECIDENIGRYRCKERCPFYAQIPANCRLIVDPKDSCCRIPQCTPVAPPTPGPTPGPSVHPPVNPSPGVSTFAPSLGPSVGPSLGPGVSPTPGPNPVNPTPGPTPPKNVCVYKGRQYVTGQKWFDGCDAVCVCENGMTGSYRCDTRCAKYNNIPSTCTLVSDPNDPVCCKVPQCIPIPGQPGVTTPGPSAGPVVVTGSPLGTVTGFGPAPTPGPTAAPTPGPDGSTMPPPSPAPRDACMYGGSSYKQGQMWQDGCKYNCICEDGKTGKYQCKQRCATYPVIPPQCTMKRDPKDLCCFVPVCDFNQVVPTPGPFGQPSLVPGLSPTPGPNPSPGTGPSPSPGTGPNPSPGTGPNPSPGGPTPAPGTGPNPTPGPSMGPQPTQSPVPSFCVYNGVPFRQGQTWTEGCTKKCRCDNADMNIYTCFDRCATYKNIGAGCTMVADPSDSCCQIPSCTYIPTPQPNPNPNPNPQPSPGTSGQTPTLGPGQSPTPRPSGMPTPSAVPGQVPTNAPTPFPSPVPTAQPGVINGGPQPNPDTHLPQTNIGYCEYKGVQYKQGQYWDDGCSYNCTCIDQYRGNYQCYQRCPRYVNIPSYCTMVQDPKDRCCKTPNCPGLTPTLSPTLGPSLPPGVSPSIPPPGVSTLSPPIGPTPAPTPAPPKEVCIYQGRMYTQGQKWYDNCEKYCVCDNAKTGAYSCTDRCAKYVGLNKNCVLVPDPRDPVCCKTPSCNSNQNTTNPTGVIGQVTGTRPTQAPTLAPNPNPTLAPNVSPGGPTLSPPLNPTKAPSPGPGVPTPGGSPAPPPEVCVYGGKNYKQGQRWQDGCKYNCICEDGKTGRYVCNDRCARYPNLPATCHMVYNPTDPCCPKPVCSGGQTPLLPPTNAPNPNPNASPTPGPNPNPGVSPSPGPNPNPGVSPSPGTNPNPSLGPNPNPNASPTPGPSVGPTPGPTPSTDFCVYQGIPFRQGQSFNQGCDKICKCEDAKIGKITCAERCPTYPALKAGCSLVTDPNDQCCQIPSCVPDPITGIVPSPTGTIVGSNLPGNNPFPVGGSRNACVYNGKIYNQGQTWDDGCTYHCICVDATTGQYRCTERCPRFPQLPSYCTKVQDPNDKCCQKPYCQPKAPTPNPLQPTPGPSAGPNVSPVAPGVSPTPGPSPGPGVSPTPGPGPNPFPTPGPNPQPNPVCVYKGSQYQQGQLWYDDCNAICRCENASINVYRCQQRCADYPNLQPGCTLVPDPKDAACCKIPQCTVVPPTGPVPTPGLFPVTGQPGGQVTGFGKIPTMAPPLNPTPAPSPGVSTQRPPLVPTPTLGCQYKGMVFNKGQKWDDGCDYECECIDDHTGQYKCVEKCHKYTNLPKACVLVQDRSKPCCTVPFCDFTNPTPFPHGVPTPGPMLVPTPPPGVQTVAPYLTPTLTPSPGPNPVPTSGPIPGTNVSPTPAPPPGGQPTPAPTVPEGFCVYKGVYYKQGQSWFDGCNQKCRCEDVQTGYYTCTQRCATYNNLPAMCVLRTDPSDPCCLVPVCNNIPNPIPVKPTPMPPSGSTNAPIPGMSTSAKPPQFIYPTGVSGSFTGTGKVPPYNVDYNPGQSISGQGRSCVYKGVVYMQNQKWNDGCNYNCECIDAVRGQYRCTDRCLKYYYLPPQCHYEQDPNDACCRKPKCDLYLTPTPKPLTVNPGSGQPVTGSNSPITVNPGSGQPITGSNQPITVNPGSGQPITGSNSPITLNPGTGPGITGSVTQPTPSTVCVYNGKMYAKGASWKDGCSDCVCDDPATNSFRCNGRCRVYSGLPAFCTLVTDPADPCCKKPQCSAVPGTGQVLTPVQGGGISGSATPPPGSLNVLPVGTHTTFTGSQLPPNPSGTTGSFGGRNACIYKGSVHQQGQSWDDGCNYVCTCEDAKTGRYRCVSKCPQYPALPSYCKSLTVPGLCCPSITCDIPGFGTYTPVPQLVPTPAPTRLPGAPTPTPGSLIVVPGTGSGSISGSSLPGGGYYMPNLTDTGFTGQLRGKCVYKNSLYNQGETWDDGCNYHCECLEGTTGYYSCKPLCPTYDNLPSNQCYLVKAQGQCCAQPMCYNPTTGKYVNPMTSTAVFPVVGSYTGGFTGFRPGYVFPGSSFGGSRRGCVYKGTVYTQGQHWEDGCDFSCDCTDETRGQYQCHAKCPSYTKIPPICRLVAQPGKCCRRLTCTQQGFSTPASLYTPTVPPTVSKAPTGNCFDRLDNCREYGKNACGATFKAWATRNCERYCGICTPTVTTPTPPCVDKLSNCNVYGRQSCIGVYEPWARDNCIQYCGLCPTPGVTHAVTVPTTTSDCVDVNSDCAVLGKFYCSPSYHDFALQNCKKYCGLCGGGSGVVTTPTPTTSGTIPTYGWQILMKGEAGQRGPDLYNLWSGSGTLNTNKPNANSYYATINGHYKPDTSNHWPDYCFDKVKVSIYNQGVEKAYVVFNAVGADKMSWFEPNRIIDSSWTDLTTARKEFFSMVGDTNTGRHFYASSHSAMNGCDAYGWIMISTKDTCDFEKGDAKPTFYYSPIQTQAHWGFTNPGTGDVFTIQGHATCYPTQGPGRVTTTNTPLGCEYKGVKYGQNAVWQDGCQYNCTCEDAAVGFYKCRNQCPEYTGLPSSCKLVKQNGKCCPEPDCGSGFTFNPITIKPLVFTVNPTKSCYYKGQYYSQGQKWDDGCDLKCTCIDGPTGQYQCGAKCLTWNLPPQCQLLDPRPGKCCRRPYCPPSTHIVINYPPGYKEE